MRAAWQARWRGYGMILVAGLAFATVSAGCAKQQPMEEPEAQRAPAAAADAAEARKEAVEKEAADRKKAAAEKEAAIKQAAGGAGNGSAAGPAAVHKPIQHNKPTLAPLPDQPPATAEEKLEAAVRHLRVGGLAYSFPETMKTGQQDDVVASIGSDKVTAAALQAHVAAAEPGQAVNLEQTPITTKMKMTLTSADFDITPQSSEEQMVVGTTPTTWRWTVAPKHSGELHLHLAAIIELENLQQDFTTVDRDVAVQVDPLNAVETFIENNWQWLLSGSGGVAVVGTVWGFFRRKKTSEDKDPV
ncbi:hypothetical protein [Edaphobacter sp. 12200R-103]|uniref:hypothetical protein n=1 Tax=Edaphobacter sp. 12200R-103 TaxID=2703788 RepID=UPI00139203A7|nr:hypothetical protein [Edaphobacter sp. 12200R-103]